MKPRTKISVLFSLLPLIVLQAQEEKTYPADTLLSKPSVSLARKAFILPIAGWQRISYSTGGLNCQYYPSCSNYGALSIANHGIGVGTLMAADRITRCNPAAFDYHAQGSQDFLTADFRIKDPVNLSAADTDKSPLLAAVLSALLPGSGRIYAGRTWDGIFGLIMFSMPAASAYRMRDNTGSFGFMFYASAAAVFYGGEIYGAWRSAKYETKTN